MLAKEKALTHQRDALAREQRVRVEKEYVFETRHGGRWDLFGGKSQLLIYHFMFGPEWTGMPVVLDGDGHDECELCACDAG